MCVKMFVNSERKLPTEAQCVEWNLHLGRDAEESRNLAFLKQSRPVHIIEQTIKEMCKIIIHTPVLGDNYICVHLALRDFYFWEKKDYLCRFYLLLLLLIKINVTIM